MVKSETRRRRLHERPDPVGHHEKFVAGVQIDGSRRVNNILQQAKRRSARRVEKFDRAAGPSQERRYMTGPDIGQPVRLAVESCNQQNDECAARIALCQSSVDEMHGVLRRPKESCGIRARRNAPEQGVRPCHHQRRAGSFVRDVAAATDPAWRALATLPQRWTAPGFPLKSADFTRRGVAAGPALGAAMRAAKEAWIAADFPAGHDAVEAIAERAAQEAKAAR